MDRDQSMTTMEYVAYRRLQKEKTIGQDKATAQEKKALNRLVKKGLVLAIEGGWRLKDEN